MDPEDLGTDKPDKSTGYSEWALSLVSLVQRSHSEYHWSHSSCKDVENGWHGALFEGIRCNKIS